MNNLQEISEELKRIDPDLVLEKSRICHFLSILNKDEIYRIFDPKTTIPKFRLPKTQDEMPQLTGEVIEGRTVGYIDLASRKYFDGETVDGPPYATGGRYFDMSTAVYDLFEKNNWDILCK